MCAIISTVKINSQWQIVNVEVMNLYDNRFMIVIAY